MESITNHASPNKLARETERKNEISINQKHKFEVKNHSATDVLRSNASKVLKRQSSLDANGIQMKTDGCNRNSSTKQENRNVIHQKIEGILHKGSDNYGNYNRVNKGIQASFEGSSQTKTGKSIKYSKSFDETAYVNKKTQTSLENVNAIPSKTSSSYSFDGMNQQARRKKMEQADYYENEKQKCATVKEEQPMDTRSKKLQLELSRDEQEQQSIIYQKMMSALNQNKSITPTDYEEKSFANTIYERSSYSKPITECNRKPISGTNGNNWNYRTEKSKTRGYSTKVPQEQMSTHNEECEYMSQIEQKKMLMKKSQSMHNYTESSIENCSSQIKYEKTSFRPTTKSFSFDLEKRDGCENTNKITSRQDFIKISKPNCDILRKQTSQSNEAGCGLADKDLKPRGNKKPLILHETKVAHPLESEPLESIIGKGFADDRRIQTPLILKQINDNNQLNVNNQRDYCYWTTRNSRKNSASMISDEAIIGKGFLDDEEFIEFYSLKQPKLKQVPEELQISAEIPVDKKKNSPKFNLNKNEIKKYFLLHGNNEPVRAKIKCEQGVYKEVPVKPIVKKIINSSETYNNEELHFNLNYEVPGEVQNKDSNNNTYYNSNHRDKLYGKRDLNQNEYVELGGSKTKPSSVDHHYEVLQTKYNGNDTEKIYEVPKVLHQATLDDDVFADEKTVKHLGEDYLNVPSTKYRKSPMLWYINDQVISFHHDIPTIVANKKISLPVSSNIRPLGFPSSKTSYYSLHNFDMHRQTTQMRNPDNYTSLIRPLILG